VLLGSGAGWAARSWVESAVGQVAALEPRSSAIVDPQAQTGDENVLILANDTTPAASGTEAATSAAAEGRADTIVLAHVPAGGERIVAVSFPPDLQIDRPTCERWDPVSGTYLAETVPAEAGATLASAYSVGGPRCSVRAVQQLSGIAVTRFAAFDLGDTAGLVDALGGVEVCVERPVVDGVLGPIIPDAGTGLVDGSRARDLVRARAVDGDPAPLAGLVERQLRLLAAALDTTLSLPVLLDPSRLPAVADALRAGATTDAADLERLLTVTRSLQDLDAEGVTFVAVPTQAEGAGDGPVTLRDADAAALFAALREDAALPEGIEEGAQDRGPQPADVTIQVLNASDQVGLAGQVAETLGNLGFGIGEVTNATQPTTETIVRFSPDQAAAAALVAESVPSATTVPDPGASGVLQLVLGRGFDGTVRPPEVEPPDVTAAATPSAPAVSCG
ncbi:MAG TPA: LCP family protein, partial [Pseudonocardia sp.]|nr:LCP family protein [Pseudonocardia sp.]